MFWYIDPSHTAVNFSVKHMMVTTVRGSLGKVRGRIELDPEHPEKGDFEISATLTIDRTDFGLTWNMPIPNGVLVGDKVKIEVDLEALDEATAKTRGLAA